jgi:hypothetical protein
MIMTANPLEHPSSDAALQRLNQMESKSKLIEICHNAVIGTMAAALSIVEFRDCSDKDIWQQIRAKILDAGNDHFRDLQAKLDMFEVEHVPRSQVSFEINDRSRMEIEEERTE